MIPSCGLLPSDRSPEMNRILGFKDRDGIDLEGQRFIEERLEKRTYTKYGSVDKYLSTNEYIYGNVYKLNYDNNCYFYKPTLTAMIKSFFKKF